MLYTGQIIWSFGGQITTRCDIDTTYYPFDKQTCKVILMNWAYNGAEVLLRNRSHEIQLEDYSSNGVWNLDKTDSHYEDVYIANDPNPYPRIHFTMYLSRKAKYFLINLVVPCLLLITVSLAVFWIPAESGEKISLGITTLLAFSVFLIVLADTTPVNSDYTPVLGQMVIGIMALSTVSVMTSILILYIHNKKYDQPVPAKLRTFFFRGIATVVCMRSDVPDDSPAAVTPAVLSPDAEKAKQANMAWPRDDDSLPVLVDHDLQKIANELSYITQRLKSQDKAEKILDEWQALARVLDRLFFWLALILIIIILGYFLGRTDPEY